MAKVEVETLTERCGEDCPYMKIDSDSYYSGSKVFLNRRYCANLALCLHAAEQWVKQMAEGTEEEK